VTLLYNSYAIVVNAVILKTVRTNTAGFGKHSGLIPRDVQPVIMALEKGTGYRD